MSERISRPAIGGANPRGARKRARRSFTTEELESSYFRDQLIAASLKHVFVPDNDSTAQISAIN